jgi:hypothetical protein
VRYQDGHMSQATEAKTARERAAIAARLIRQGIRSRALDDCFEMYDGDEVLRLLRARKDARIDAVLCYSSLEPEVTP